jgi:hypothetical protein
MSGKKLLGAQHRERHEQLRANLVLPTFTMRRGYERRAIALAVREVGQHRVVLVVGMRRRHHEVTDSVELAQCEFQRRLALEGGDGNELMLCSGVRGCSRDDYGSDE